MLRLPSMRPALATGLATAFVCLLALPQANAQDSSKASREREGLRRAQAALQHTTAERDALTAEKAALAGQLADTQAQLAKAQAASRALQASSLQQVAALARQHGELAASRLAVQQAASATATSAEASTSQALALQQQLATLRSESAGRAQTVAALVQLLERSVTALAAAELANAQLFAAGLDAVNRLRSKTLDDSQARADPMLGLRAVQIENEAEALRSALDKLRITH